LEGAGRPALLQSRVLPADKPVEDIFAGLRAMIRLTRINRVPLVLNSDQIEHIESTPDTVISLTNGQKFVVLESVDQVIDKVIDFRRAIACGTWSGKDWTRKDNGTNA
jgi:flagellar protein FlbD